MFREEALKHQASPDRLDQAIRIIPFRAWFMLICFFILLAFIILWSIFSRIPVAIVTPCFLYPESGGIRTWHSFVQGTVDQFYVKPGEFVKEGQPLGTLLALSPEDEQAGRAPTRRVTVSAWRPSVVLGIYINPAEWISPGSPIMGLASFENTPLIAYAFVNPTDAKDLLPGMSALIDFGGSNDIKANVRYVAPYPIDKSELSSLMRSESLANKVLERVPVPYEVIISLEHSNNTYPIKYHWTDNHAHPDITPGTVAKARIVLGKQTPISTIFPWAK